MKFTVEVEGNCGKFWKNVKMTRTREPLVSRKIANVSEDVLNTNRRLEKRKMDQRPYD